MKITMYELLGMIKDGKASDITTNFMFEREKYNLLAFLDVYTLDINSLNWEIEILEEEKKIPEKIEIYEDSEGHYFIDNHCKKIYITCDEVNFMVEEFNNLIDYIKSKGDE